MASCSVLCGPWVVVGVVVVEGCTGGPPGSISSSVSSPSSFSSSGCLELLIFDNDRGLASWASSWHHLTQQNFKKSKPCLSARFPHLCLLSPLVEISTSAGSYICLFSPRQLHMFTQPTGGSFHSLRAASSLIRQAHCVTHHVCLHLWSTLLQLPASVQLAPITYHFTPGTFLTLVLF